MAEVELGRKSTKRIQEMDALRGLASLAVVLFHYLYFFPRIHGVGDVVPLAFWGQFGVQFFFMISGFVIFMSAYNHPNAIAFGIKRFIRLYPTFWVCCLLTVVAIALFGGAIPPVAQILINGTMLAGALATPYIDGAYWSLIPELIFYFHIFLFLLFKQQKNLYYWGTGFLIAAVVSMLFLPKEVIFILNLKWFPLFWIGINAFLLTKKTYGYLPVAHIVASLIAIALIFHDASILLASCLLLLVLIASTRGLLKFLSSPPLILLGAISFPVYLLHQVIGLHIIRAFSTMGISTSVSIAITTGIILGLAYLVHIAIEKPAISISRKIN
jgi:peptidoglycan/LPS O-acetylase OafA/YrhL